MDRLWLLPALVNENTGFWRRVFYGLVVTSVEAFLAVACLLAGVPVLIDPSQFAPMSINALDAWLVYPWGAGMLSGGMLTLVGISSNRFRVERMGISILAFVAFVYFFGLLAFLPLSLFACLSYGLFFLSMLGRYWVLGKVINYENNLRKEIASILKGTDE